MAFSNFVQSIVSLVKVTDNAEEPVKPSKPSPSLPPEVLSAIFEHGYFNDDYEVDTLFLMSCCLVCKAWSGPAQSMLFRDVRLRTMADYESFCSAVDNDMYHARTLADVVVRLRLVIDLKHPDALSHGAFERAIGLCPNLYELDLAVYGGGCEAPVPVDKEPTLDAGASTDSLRVSLSAPSFPATTLNALRSGPKIRSLRFTNLTDNGNLTLQLLGACPSLIALELKGVVPLLPVLPEDVSNPFRCACQLKNVKLGFSTQPKMAFINWLFGNSRDTIRSLELSQETSIEFLSSVLKTYGNQLYSLALPSCTPREYVATVTSHCMSLRELSLGSAAPSLSPLLFKQLASPLEHVAFALSRDTPLYPVLRFISDRKKNAHLNVVTVLLWGGAEVHPQLPSLKMACTMQGIELRVVRSAWAFRTLVRGDSLPSSTFPQSKSVANLYRMLAISRAGSSAVEHVTAERATESGLPVCEERYLPVYLHQPREDDGDPGLRDLELDAAVVGEDEDVLIDDKAAVREDELFATWKVTASD